MPCHCTDSNKSIPKDRVLPVLHLQSQSFFIKLACLPALLAQLVMLNICTIELKVPEICG